VKHLKRIIVKLNWILFRCVVLPCQHFLIVSCCFPSNLDTLLPYWITVAVICFLAANSGGWFHTSIDTPQCSATSTSTHADPGCASTLIQYAGTSVVCLLVFLFNCAHFCYAWAEAQLTHLIN
jgi:hypothetical protein